MKYLRMTITDTLGFWDDDVGSHVFNPSNGMTFTSWFRVPDNWLSGGEISAERRETLLRHLYGDTWRSGNEDGSLSVVLASDLHVLTPEESGHRPWSATNEGCYHVAESGAVTRVDAAAL